MLKQVNNQDIDSIFIVGTPHQCHQIRHALTYFGLAARSVIVIAVCELANMAYINIYTNQLGINNFIHVPIWRARHLLLLSSAARSYIKVLESIRGSMRIKNIFTSHVLSDPEILAFSMFSKGTSFYLLDEGNASIAIAGNISKRYGSVVYKVKLMLKQLFFLRRLQVPEKIKFFSQYDIKASYPDEIILYKPIKRHLDNILRYCNDPLNSSDVVVHFLGSSVVELGLVDHHQYVTWMREVRRIFRNAEIIYFPHRKELTSNLEKIKKEGFKISSTNEPYENMIESFSISPDVVSSLFFCSALFKLETTYTNPPHLVYFLVDCKKFLKSNEVFVDTLEALRHQSKSIFVQI